MVGCIEVNHQDSWLIRCTESGYGSKLLGVITAERVDDETVKLKGGFGELPPYTWVRDELRKLGFKWMIWEKLRRDGTLKPFRFRV